MEKSLISPRPLRKGDTIGVFTPSSPGYNFSSALFENGLATLQRLGFKIKLGKLTEKRAADGYRSGTGSARADEFMSLIRDPHVNALMATIGGYNSNSMIPFLDFEEIRESRKVICGYSDVTSLHLSILKYSRLRTFYGPTVMCWFGEWPNGITESSQWFMDAVMEDGASSREIVRPSRWSNHKRNWSNDDWKTLPREWIDNLGWRVLRSGLVEAPIIAANLNTLLSAAGWLVLPADLPLVRSETLLDVARALASHPVVVPVFEGQRGHPVGFDASCGPELRNLKGNRGGAQVMIARGAMELIVDDPGVCFDIDTVADLLRAQAWLDSQAG